MQCKGLKYRDFLNSFKGEFKFFPKLGDDPTTGKRIYLRHDVDFNLLSAVQMSQEEAELGIKSTYFILNTAEYWKFDISKALEIIASGGHEIAWHNNALAQFYGYNKGKDLRQIIEEVLTQFNDYGIFVRGSASHGDELCASMQFLNYHAWDIPGMAFQRFVRRSDHPVFKLEDFNLEYEAYFVNWPRGRIPYAYLTDSGAKFNIDPKKAAQTFNEAENYTLQALIHPDWWVI